MRAHNFLLKMTVGIISVLLLGTAAVAAGFPEKPIQLLVGWPVGSLNDLVDRAIANSLTKTLKQPAIVQNLPGGGGALVLGRIKTTKPDGYTLFQTGMNAFSQVPLLRHAPYDPLKDFAFLAQHVSGEHYMLCRPDSPWKNFEEMIQYVKKNPRKVTYSTSGVGGSAHLSMEYLALKENLQWIHVPYNSGTEVISALLGGHVALSTTNLGNEIEYVKTGRLKPLLCMNSKRMSVLPDLPTIVEKGYDFSCVSSWIWTVPVDTPKDIQKILESALLKAMAEPEARGVMKKLNLTYDPLGSEALVKAVLKDYEKYSMLLKELGLGIFKK